MINSINNVLGKRKLISNCDRQIIVDKLQIIDKIQHNVTYWRSMRERLVSSTSVASIVGVNKYKSLRQIYKEKTNKKNNNRHKNTKLFDNKYKSAYTKKKHYKSNTFTNCTAMNWGMAYESIAINCFEERNDLQIIPTNLGTHKTMSFLSASPDGIYIDDYGDIWLLEIKCLYTREINNKIPINNLLQIQTQLYVWSSLLDNMGLKLKGCMYCENKFVEIHSTDKKRKLFAYGYNDMRKSYYILDNYWETEVHLNIIDYEDNVLNHITNFRYFLSSCDKEEYENNYVKYLESDCIIDQDSYINYINNNTISYTLINNALRQHIWYKNTVFCVINDSFVASDIANIGFSNKDDILYDNLKKTVVAIKNNIPIIINCQLITTYNNNTVDIGKYDLIVRNDYINKLLNISLTIDKPLGYSIIQIKYCSNKDLNKTHFVELLHLKNVLQNVIPNVLTNIDCYIFDMFGNLKCIDNLDKYKDIITNTRELIIAKTIVK